MPTRIVLSDNIWFVVEQSVKEVSSLFELNSKTMTVSVIDGYEASIVKDRIACFVDVIVQPIEDQIDLINVEESIVSDVHAQFMLSQQGAAEKSVALFYCTNVPYAIYLLYTREE